MGQCCASDQGKTTTDGMAPKIQDQGQKQNKRTLQRSTTKAKETQKLEASLKAKDLDSINQQKEKTPEKKPAENNASNSSAAEDSTSVTTP